MTVFAHGVGASIAETRLLGVGVAGAQALLHFRGHGASRALAPQDVRSWGYDALAGDLRAVADAAGATRALGVSMGAAALLRLLAGPHGTPDRFERLVFFLPAVLDAPRDDVGFERLAQLADLIEAGGVAALAAHLLGELPVAAQATPAAGAWTRQRAGELMTSGVPHLLRALPPQTPIPVGQAVPALADVTAPALVIGQEGDRVHPAGVARALAGALPDGRLEVFDEQGAVWEPASRARLRGLLTGFLA